MPGLTVAELLEVLKITKQSLARVLKQLIDSGHITQIQGLQDRRQRELYPTARAAADLPWIWPSRNHAAFALP